VAASKLQGRDRAIDGLRGVAIAIVLLGHLCRTAFAHEGIVGIVVAPFRNPDLGVPRPLLGLGVISFSGYLWQQYFAIEDSAPEMRLFPSAVAATLGCALISSFLVERPCQRLKSRFTRTKREAADAETPF
jgi:peptidoglycan/LPS O-acetylase OafA/YrhL